MTTMPPETRPALGPILVWDWPVRVFHALLALCFAGAWLTAEHEAWRLVHVTLGYTFGGLLAFRLLWGVVGTRHARFVDFVRGPTALKTYLLSLLGSRPGHHAGHNPAGAWAILAMLGLGVAITASGWFSYQDMAGEWLNEMHEALASTMLGVVGVHIAGVWLSGRLHGENLARAMVTGRKLGPPGQGIPTSHPVLGMLLLVAVLGFWTWQWLHAPSPQQAGLNPPASTAHTHHRHDDDD